jgi:hypothetical protein
MNAHNTGVFGEAGYCFFKGKIFPTSLKKKKIVHFILARRNGGAY